MAEIPCRRGQPHEPQAVCALRPRAGPEVAHSSQTRTLVAAARQSRKCQVYRCARQSTVVLESIYTSSNMKFRA